MLTGGTTRVKNSDPLIGGARPNRARRSFPHPPCLKNHKTMAAGVRTITIPVAAAHACTTAANYTSLTTQVQSVAYPLPLYTLATKMAKVSKLQQLLRTLWPHTPTPPPPSSPLPPPLNIPRTNPQTTHLLLRLIPRALARPHHLPILHLESTLSLPRPCSMCTLCPPHQVLL